MALGLFQLTFDLSAPTPNHVETSLREWIPQQQFKDINPVLGGIAQLLMQVLGEVSSEEQEEKLQDALEAMLMNHHETYHIALLWFVIKQVRSYYRKERVVEDYDSGAEDDEEDREFMEVASIS